MSHPVPTMGQGYCDFELIRDASGRAVEQRYLTLNSAIEQMFGIPAADATGRLSSGVFPELEPWWHAAFDRIAWQGAPELCGEASPERPVCH